MEVYGTESIAQVRIHIVLEVLPQNFNMITEVQCDEIAYPIFQLMSWPFNAYNA